MIYEQFLAEISGCAVRNFCFPPPNALTFPQKPCKIKTRAAGVLAVPCTCNPL